MKSFALLLLVAASAFGQTTETSRVSKGDLLKQRQYRTSGVATTGDLVFYVDPTGNDANQCTSTGTDACLTFQGAINKAPKLLRNRVTVTGAAGNYAGFTLSGFTIDGSLQKTTAGILIDGALANVTPATGSATGTATAGTAGSNTTFGTLTDAAATWTVNDLRGRFITITGGTGSGQIKAIASNTATAITIAGTWTAPTGTSTYAIQYPSVIFTSSAALVPNPTTGTNIIAAALQIFDNELGTVFTSGFGIAVRNIAFNNAATYVVAGIGSSVSFLQTGFGTAGCSGTIAQGAVVSVTASTGTCVASTPFSVGSFGQLSLTTSAVTSNQGVVSVSDTGAASISSSQFGGMTLASQGSITGLRSAVIRLTSMRCDCASTSNSACLNFGGGTAPATGVSLPGTATISSGLDVTNCNYGIAAQGGATILFTTPASTFTGNALTYAVTSILGSKVILPTTSAITGATAEMSLDNGAVTDSFSALAATYSCLTSLSTTSSICRL